ncbi:unnamed protein product [Blepharisma stoltei]|uniref:RING-type domain-containing protein n=1 Tax=Blepharisma stoltei TaxID=1481888 RepID=A0AAU9JFI8_9CILI|nr:unnamed protein product [Blepharisma stoltei]
MSDSNEKPSCYACGAILERDHIGITCPQYHNLCSDCSKKFVDNIFEDYQANLPPKCPMCTLEIPALNFERQLSPAALATYQFYLASTKLEEGEAMQWCPKCNYFEIWCTTSTATLFYCRNPSCEDVVCIFCNKSVKLPDYEEFTNREINSDEDEQDIEEEYEKMLEEGFFYHQICVELYPMKKKIDNAIEEGEFRRCPQCGLSGRKDEYCTHMTCSVCQTVWCYFCGKKEADCDKDYTGNDIYAHNIDWIRNNKRCPMHFNQIHELDERWPENDEDCLNRFHQLLTLKSLKKAIDEIGENNYYKIAEHFPSIKNNGYGIQEILSVQEEPLIDMARADEFSEGRRSHSDEDSLDPFEDEEIEELAAGIDEL